MFCSKIIFNQLFLKQLKHINTTNIMVVNIVGENLIDTLWTPRPDLPGIFQLDFHLWCRSDVGSKSRNGTEGDIQHFGHQSFYCMLYYDSLWTWLLKNCVKKIQFKWQIGHLKTFTKCSFSQGIDLLVALKGVMNGKEEGRDPSTSFASRHNFWFTLILRRPCLWHDVSGSDVEDKTCL